MAEIMLDFIQCHYCGKRYDPPDPEAYEHWRECQNAPARKVCANLVKACEDLIEAMEPMLRRGSGLSPSQRAGFPTYAITQAKHAIAEASK